MEKCTAPLVSVILPVYNVQLYLQQCLESIIAQSLKNIEIIAIDDCSSDASRDILQEYAQRDTRVKLIFNDRRLGAAESRNIGFERSSGDYVAFFDSDDYFDLNLLEKSYYKAIDNNADVILWDYYTFDDETDKTTRMQLPFYLSSRANQVCNVGSLDEGGINFFPFPSWTRLLSQEFIKDNNLKFQDIPNSNDVYFGYMSILTAKRFVYINEPLVYHRIKRIGQISSDRGTNPMCSYLALKKIKDTVEEKKISLSIEIFKNLVLRVFMFTYIAPGITPEIRREFSSFLLKKGFCQLGINDVSDNKWLFPIDSVRWNHLMKFINDSNFSELTIPWKKGLEGVWNDSVFELLHMTGKKFCLWGIKNRGQFFLNKAQKNNFSIDCIIDQDLSLKNQVVSGYTVLSADSQMIEYDTVIVTNMCYIGDIIRLLKKLDKFGVKVVDLDFYLCYRLPWEKCVYCI